MYYSLISPKNPKNPKNPENPHTPLTLPGSWYRLVPVEPQTPQNKGGHTPGRATSDPSTAVVSDSPSSSRRRFPNVIPEGDWTREEHAWGQYGLLTQDVPNLGEDVAANKALVLCLTSFDITSFAHWWVSSVA